MMIQSKRLHNNRFNIIIVCVFIVVGLFSGVAYADSGIDVSNHQGCINASKAAEVRNDGGSFAFVKATEGISFVDKYANCSMDGFAKAGIRRGVYHFAHVSGNSAVAEATFFINNTRGYVNSGVIPVLDWEPRGDLKKDTVWAKTWLDTVAKAWGTKPMIYMSANTIRIADWSAVADADYGLWVAGYPKGYAGDRLRNPGSVPYSVSPWKFAAAWQYSSSGKVAGINGNVDVNFFYGDAVTWAKYANEQLPTASSESAKTSTTPVASDSELASAVISGAYGNDPQRRQLLGDRYAAVQVIVNKRMGVSASRVRIVKRGDTLWGMFGLRWRSVAVANGITNPRALRVGQRIRY